MTLWKSVNDIPASVFLNIKWNYNLSLSFLPSNPEKKSKYSNSKWMPVLVKILQIIPIDEGYCTKHFYARYNCTVIELISSKHSRSLNSKACWHFDILGLWLAVSTCLTDVSKKEIFFKKITNKTNIHSLCLVNWIQYID